MANTIKKAHLSMVPQGAIDWAKEDVELISNSGVHHKRTDRPLSENHLTCYIAYRPTMVSIDVDPKGDYLAITGYELCRPADIDWLARGYTGGVMEFKDALQHDQAHPQLACNCQSREASNTRGVQIRIYKDGQAVLLRRAILPIGPKGAEQEVYYVRPTELEGLASWWGLPNGCHHEGEEYNLDPEVSKAILVYNDEEVKAHKAKVTLKRISGLIKAVGGKAAQDLRGHWIYYKNAYDTAAMSASTAEIVSDFLGAEDPSQAYRLQAWKKKTGRLGTCNTGLKGHGLTLEDILTFIAMPLQPPTTRVSTQEIVKEILDVIPDQYKTATTPVLIGRTGSKVFLYRGHVRGGYLRDCGNMVVYDTAKRTRFVAYTEDGREWAKTIPSMGQAASAIYQSEGDTTPYVLLSNKSLEDIFQGTNVGWALQFLGDKPLREVMTPGRIRGFARANSDAATALVSSLKFKDFMASPVAINTIVRLLYSSNNKMLELLLKSQLPMIFWKALGALETNSWNDQFHDLDKPETTESYRWTCRADKRWDYHSKATSLTDMFGTSLKVLRALDQELTTPVPSACYHTRELFPFSTVEKKIDVKLATLAPQQLTALFRATDSTYGSYDCSYQLFHGAAMLSGLPAESPVPVDRFLWAINKYNSTLHLAEDYLNLVAKLKAFQEARPETAGTWNPAAYPLRPEKGTQFIRYFLGMRDPFTSSRYAMRLGSSRELEQTIKRAFPEAYEEGRVQAIHEDDVLLGFKVTVTASENLRWCHDRAANDYNMIKDAAKTAAFTPAAQRVKHLEWDDPKEDLCIRAPKDLGELQAEGGVLHHCVASYADAIIDGKENIMFLRRKSRPDNPYYTVEVLPNGQIRQVHCYANGDLTPAGQAKAYQHSGYEVYAKTEDIVGFLLRWTKAMKGQIDAKTVASYYGALCHL